MGIQKKSPLRNVFLTVTFQVRTFSHPVNVFAKNHFLQFTETNICRVVAFHTIAHMIP